MIPLNGARHTRPGTALLVAGVLAAAHALPAASSAAARPAPAVEPVVLHGAVRLQDADSLQEGDGREQAQPDEDTARPPLDSAGLVSSQTGWSEFEFEEPGGFFSGAPGWFFPLVLILVVLGLAAAAAAVLYRRGLTGASPIWRRGDERDDEWPLPPLIVPAHPERQAATRRSEHPPAARDGRGRTPAAATDRVQDSADVAPARRRFQPAPPEQQEPVHADPAVAAPVPPDPDGDAIAAHGETVDAGPIRFHRPPEGTLQLLPGRLEIIGGGEQQDEIRFVKVSGREPAVTFGRSPGEPHTHIQLRSPTVSREHAVLRYQRGQWYIQNLSQTNPVVVNGRMLPADDASRAVTLSDGDRIEMGEVVFLFRWR